MTDQYSYEITSPQQPNNQLLLCIASFTW